MRWLTVIVVALGAVLGGYFLYQRLAVPTLTVTEAVRGPVVQAFYATGTLQPAREYSIKSNVDGVLTEVLVDKGDLVTEGQKVAFVVVEEYQMRHSQAMADLTLKKQLAADETSPALLEFDTKLKAATLQLDIAQDEAKRLSDALANKAAAQVDVDRARYRVQTVWSLVESIKSQKAAKKLELERDATVAQAALDIAQWNLDQQTIRSPVSGSVLDRPISSGTRVKINDHLMQVADVAPQNLIMRAAVDEEDKVRLELDQNVVMTLYSYPGKTFQGKVRQVYPQADQDRRTFEVDVAIIPGDPRFAAGMTGELAFIVDSKESATVIPSQALQAGSVWLVRGERLEKADAVLGLRSIERIEIVSGVSPGDRVVISPVGALTPGQHVKTKFMDPVEAAGLNKPKQTDSNFKGFG